MTSVTPLSILQQNHVKLNHFNNNVSNFIVQTVYSNKNSLMRWNLPNSYKPKLKNLNGN